MKIVIATRSKDATLYDMASSFWPADIERLRMTGLDDWRDALTYLEGLVRLDVDVVVNVDEDCFVTNWGEVQQVITYMQLGGFAYAGMPDWVEECHHRKNCRWVHNPFFSVFRPFKMASALSACDWYEKAVREGSNPPGCRMHEIFNNFYMALHEQARGLDLSGTDHADGVSTELGLAVSHLMNPKPLALHSWYSREYETDPAHRQRINNLYHEARSRRTI